MTRQFVTIFKSRFIVKIRNIFAFFLSCFLVSQTVFAQNFMQERRIYILDVTASMEGKGVIETPDIFNHVKKELYNALKSIDNPNTEIVIVPFTDVPHKPIRGMIRERDSLLNDIQALTIKEGDTNIVDAWTSGVQNIDSTRVNYIFLLTDGLHNCGPKKEMLYERLKAWENISQNKYYFAFYVMLTPNAKEQEICQIVDSTSQMWLIESMNVNVTFIASNLNIQANVNNEKTVRLTFNVSNESLPKGDLDFAIEMEENPYYAVTNFRSFIDQGYVLFDIVELMPLMDLPIEIWLKLCVRYDKKKYYMTFFTPEVINFKVINKGVREMTITENDDENN